MSEQIIFARAKPQIIRLVERYVYQADVSSLPDTQIIDTPTGLVEITIPYDGHQYFTRQAISDIEIQFPQIKNLEQSHNEVKARIGYLGLTIQWPRLSRQFWAGV